MEGVQVIGENSDRQTGGSRVTHQRERFRSQQVVGNSLVQGRLAKRCNHTRNATTAKHVQDAMATHLTLRLLACTVTAAHLPARAGSHAGRGGWDGPSHPSARPNATLSLGGKRDVKRRSLPGGAGHVDRPSERFDTIGEADESRTAGRVGPARAVVTD